MQRITLLLAVITLNACALIVTSAGEQSVRYAHVKGTGALQAKTGDTEEAERKKSKNPPEGAPWTKDFFEAHKQAFNSGKPIFLYSTKTY